MDTKKLLNKIIYEENMKTKKSRLVSGAVLDTWADLVRGNIKSEPYRKEALKLYTSAQQTNTPISQLNYSKANIKRGIKAKVKKNVDDYKNQTVNEENSFLQSADFSEPVEIPNHKILENKKFYIPPQIRKIMSEALEWGNKAAVKYIKETKNRISSPFKVSVYARIQIKKLHNGRIIFNTVNIDIKQAMLIKSNEDIEKFEKSFVNHAIKNFVQMQIEHSGWSFDAMAYIYLTTYETKPLRAASYIVSPEKLRNAKCGIINLRNPDNECLKWCMRYHQSAKTNHSTSIASLKKIDDKYTYEDVCFPASIEDVRTLEAQNDNMAINLFSYNEESNEPEIMSRSNTKGTDIINLLIINDGDNEHFVYIKNLDHLYKASKDGGSSNSKILCEKCLRPFTEKQFGKHSCDVSESLDFKPQINYSDETQKMKVNMTILKKMIPADFYITTDFEASLPKTNDKNKIHKHKANSYGLKVTCTFDPSLSRKIYIYRGANAANHCLKTLLELKKELNKIVNDLRKLHKHPKLTEEEEIDFKNSNICHICETKITDGKVRDHCHLTGKYRGAACKVCNINYHNLQKNIDKTWRNQDIPVIFHNLRAYDAHFIIQEASKFTKRPINVISQSFEKYMSISFEGLKFIDSILFLNSSLETLATNLKDENNEDKYINFKYMKEEFKDNIDLLCKKGTYPYEWVDDEKKFNEQSLPPPEKFYSQLTGKNITTEEYEHAQNVFKTMKCKDFGDYHDLYLTTDVLLLTDIFENFRQSAIEKYKLDPLNYVSSPSLSWDAMLLHTRQELGLIHDDESRLFFNEAKRGGIVNVGAQRYTTANHKYMKKFNPQRKSNFISYLDMNNQYGAAMCDYLPYELDGFVNDMSLDKLLNHPREDLNGFFVKCNISYPKNLHNKFKDYPPAPITTAIETDLLSDYQKDILKQNGNKHANKSKKLVLNLFDKVDYTCHYRYLQKCHQLGCIITNISKVMKFKQSQWLKPYIDKNTDYRKKAKNDFEKDLYKLLNNSIFGKTCQDVMKYSNFEIISDEKIAKKRFTHDAFKSGILLNEMFFIESSPKKVNYDKPCYIGCAILDLAKLYMLNFHYDYIKPKYGEQATLIYTDTDSFVYSIETPDLYQDQYNDRHLFDLSNVVIEKFNDKSNNKVVGKMKDETSFIPIIEFIALSAKNYSFITDYDKTDSDFLEDKVALKIHEEHLKTSKTKKAKGVVRAVIKNILSQNDYHKTLISSIQLETEQVNICPKNHQLWTIKNIKTALSAFDDKIYRDTFNTGHPYGYEPN